MGRCSHCGPPLANAPARPDHLPSPRLRKPGVIRRGLGRELSRTDNRWEDAFLTAADRQRHLALPAKDSPAPCPSASPESESQRQQLASPVVPPPKPPAPGPTRWPTRNRISYQFLISD